VIGWALAVLRGGDDGGRFMLATSHHREKVGSQR
jgi:hypothetical protein